METKEIEGGFLVPKDDQFCGKWAAEAGRLDHDRELLDKVAPYIPHGGFVIDAGAYIGDHTLFYSNLVGNDGLVLALEPHPEIAEILEHNISKFPLANTLFMQRALASRNGVGTFTTDFENPGQSSVDMDGKSIRVHFRPLDEIKVDCTDKKTDFLKLDIEGWEFDALIGARDIVFNERPVMLMEVNPACLRARKVTLEALHALLAMYGYEFNPVEEGVPSGDAVYNLLCLPS